MLTFNYQATSNMQVTVNGSTWDLGALSGPRWANIVNSKQQLAAALAASPVSWDEIQKPASLILTTAAAVATPEGNAGKFADMTAAMQNANSGAWMDFAGKLAAYLLNGDSAAATK